MRKVLTICSMFSFAALLSAQVARPPMDPMMNPDYNPNNPNKKKEVKRVVFKDKVSSSAYPLSNKRVKQINEVVKGFLDRNEKLNDEQLRKNLEFGMSLLQGNRKKLLKERYPDWESLREEGRKVKQNTLSRLPELLERFEQKATEMFPLVVWIVKDETRKESLKTYIRESLKGQPKMFLVITPDELEPMLRQYIETKELC